MSFKWKVILLLVVILAGLEASDLAKKRAKRYLGFVDKSKVFVRLNLKHNMVREYVVYAQGSGFRANFDIPWKDRHKRRHKIVKRDLYKSIEELIMHHGFDGRACVLRTLCKASEIVTPESGILLKLFKKIFTIPDGDEENYPYLTSEKCEELETHCPMSLLQLTRYTDT